VTPFKVHESRVLRFDGPIADDKTFKENNRWNESVYRKVLTQLINVNSSLASSKDILDDFVTTIVSIKNLQAMIAAGNDQLIKDRLNIMDLGKHAMNTIMLDENEKWEKQSSSVQGLPKLIEEQEQALSATADIPMTILMGRSPGGMNATGDADIRIYYDQISDAQDDDLLDPMTRLMELTMLAKEGPTKGKVEEDWFIEFRPLWQPTEKEIVETRKNQAETDNIYLQQGVLTAAEVAESRFGGDEYSIETVIDDEAERGVIDDPPPDNKIDAKGKKKKGRYDRFFDNPDLIEGVTGEENDHTHDYIIFNVESGEGWTGPAGKDNHSHRIEGGTVQFFENKKSGTVHGHTLPKVK